MKNFLAFCILILGLSPVAFAKMEVLFHPQDPTLEKIALWISSSRTVDIAMYNMDATERSPIIQTLQSEAVQQKIKTGGLQIRLLFEGYGSPESNAEKMQKLEAAGMDVRYLGHSAVAVHHKFAIFDAGLESSKVLTGSANWSVGSAKSYNENILFVSEEAEFTLRFQKEFDRLWNQSKEYGLTLPVTSRPLLPIEDSSDIKIFFNSPRTLGDPSETETYLTTELIRVIQNTQSELLIATTRARLIPVLEALRTAADRGVQISLLLNQDDYRDLHRRDPYLKNHPRLQTRVKFYNLNLNQYLAYQMHNKFLIADRKVLLTGSFNWSKSSEYNYLENLVELSGTKAQEVLPSYIGEFQKLWDLGRDRYLMLEQSLSKGSWLECEIPQMSLNPEQIQTLLKLSPHCQNSTEK